MTRDLDVVTGAFSYTGRHIARRLLRDGRRVRTLTRHGDATGELTGRVEVAPLDLADADALREQLDDAGCLYNTYWIRFPHGASTYERAVENTRRLIAAARDAGVERFVHLSVANATASSLPYFRGKGAVEAELASSGLSHAIVRPTLVFGPGEILVNNIAWLLRRLPLFIVPGDGAYRVQPVSVDDTAAIAVAAGAERSNMVIDAAGAEVYSFERLVRALAAAVRSRARVVHASPRLALRLSGLVGRLRGDVLLTREELRGLMDNLLVSDEPPRGRDSFAAWVEANAGALGRRYVSELARNYRHGPV